MMKKEPKKSRQNEASTHLGNVHVVLSDKKIAVDDGTYVGGVKQNSTPDGVVDYYTADVQATYDYYAGVGMLMPGRCWESTKYRYGAQGSEVDEEINGTRNTINTFYREGDLRRLGWDSPDPKTKDTPWESPYSFMSGNPIKNNDPRGDADGDPESGGTPSKFIINQQTGFPTGKTSGQSSLRDPSIDLKKYEHLLNPPTSQTFIGPADKPFSSSGTTVNAPIPSVQALKNPPVISSEPQKIKTALSWTGIGFSVSGEALFSKTLGTWMGKNLSFYSSTWGGNLSTGGKFSFARSLSVPLKFGGSIISVYNAFDVYDKYQTHQITGQQLFFDETINLISNIPIFGTAIGIGYGLGRGN